VDGALFEEHVVAGLSTSVEEHTHEERRRQSESREEERERESSGKKST